MNRRLAVMVTLGAGLGVALGAGVYSLLGWLTTPTTSFIAAPTAGPPRPFPEFNFALHEAPRALPEVRFEDGAGRALTLADFGGRTVLLNIWATWCVPCRREMPALDRLQKAMGGPGFEVVALSIDRQGLAVVEPFFAELGLESLAIYVDDSSNAMRTLGVVGIPTTLLLDPAGRELGRLVGPAEWDSPEILAFLREQVSRPASAAISSDRAADR